MHGQHVAAHTPVGSVEEGELPYIRIAYIHIHVHTHTHIRIYIHTYIYVHTCREHRRRGVAINTYTRTHARARARAHTHTHTHTSREGGSRCVAIKSAVGGANLTKGHNTVPALTRAPLSI